MIASRRPLEGRRDPAEALPPDLRDIQGQMRERSGGQADEAQTGDDPLAGGDV